MPPSSSEKVEGRRIERRDVKFIAPGVTTQLEVERRLGPSTRHCDRPPAITYLWKTPGWTTYWWIIGPGGTVSGDFPIEDRHAFFVAFDDKGVVLQTAFVSPWKHGSLDDQLEQWASTVRSRARPNAPTH